MLAPLRIVVLHHPQSDKARELAAAIYRRFMATAGTPGLRIPVAFVREHSDGRVPELADLQLDTAERTLVVALIDSRMARRARAAERKVADEWGLLVAELLDGSTDHRGVLPVAVDAGGLSLHERLEYVSMVRVDHFDDEPARKPGEVCFQVAVAALKLLAEQQLPAGSFDRAPIKLFVSHAKIDLPSATPGADAGPVVGLLNYLAKGPVDGWYDAKNIPRSMRFDEAIEKGVISCDVVVIVLTDHWSDREWCRREALIAKRRRIPIVLVDGITDEVGRLFPYTGNARIIRWTQSNPHAVVLAAILEALRHRHALAVLEQQRRSGDQVFGVQPEALTVRQLPAGTQRVLYPDPPLPREEIDELQPIFVTAPNAPPTQVELTTPLTELARWQRPPQAELIGLSISGATDIDRWGASSEHLATFADDSATMLLVAGLRLAYGGTFEHGVASNDEINFTRRLFGLVRSYGKVAGHLRRFSPVVNFVPWPIHLSYGDEELAFYGREAELEECPPPDGLPLEQLGTDGRSFPMDTPLRAWAWARGATRMREEMAKHICARIAVAGKLDGYVGPLPGVLEEILLARQGPRPHPLFLIGAFGGATRYAIDLMSSSPRVEASSSWVSQSVAGWTALTDTYRDQGTPFTTPEEAAEQLRALGAAGAEAALANGLDEAENQELFVSSDSRRIVELILTGLKRLFDSRDLPTGEAPPA